MNDINKSTYTNLETFLRAENLNSGFERLERLLKARVLVYEGRPFDDEQNAFSEKIRWDLMTLAPDNNFCEYVGHIGNKVKRAGKRHPDYEAMANVFKEADVDKIPGVIRVEPHMLTFVDGDKTTIHQFYLPHRRHIDPDYSPPGYIRERVELGVDWAKQHPWLTALGGIVVVSVIGGTIAWRVINPAPPMSGEYAPVQRYHFPTGQIYTEGSKPIKVNLIEECIALRTKFPNDYKEIVEDNIKGTERSLPHNELPNDNVQLEYDPEKGIITITASSTNPDKIPELFNRATDTIDNACNTP